MMQFNADLGGTRSTFVWLSQRLAGSRLGSALFGTLCGTLGTLGFAPFGWFWLLWLGLGGLLWALLKAGQRRGFALGYGYGLGLLISGVSWLAPTFAEASDVPLLLAWPLTLGLLALLALWYGLAGWFLGRLLSKRPLGASLVLLFPGLWVLFEWLRGWVLSGFPWLQSGYTLIDTSFAGFAPWLGVHGLAWLGLVSLGGLLWFVFAGKRLGLALALLVSLAGWGVGHWNFATPKGEPIATTLIQANIKQSLKWQPEHLGQSISRHLEMTEAAWGAKLILWPETAIPGMTQALWNSLLDPLEQDALAHDSEILIGIPREHEDGERYYNTLLSLGGAKTGGNSYYAKRHLVPFGEYPPWRSRLKPFFDSLNIPMSDFAAGQAARPLLKVAGHEAGVSICYEAAFAEEVRQALPEAAFLINVTNDGWFGDSLAPHQHLQIARMRALEMGRQMVRSTNTGISALIDVDGRVKASLGVGTLGNLEFELQPYTGTTPYVALGNWPILVIMSLAFIFFWAGSAHFNQQVSKGDIHA